MPALVFLTNPNAEPVTLRFKRTLIGRDPLCDLVVDSRHASRRHAMILEREGMFYLQDLDSANGTYVNQVRATAQTPLNLGDTIQIGDHVLRLQGDVDTAFRPDTTIPGGFVEPEHSPLANIVSSMSGTELPTESAPHAKLKAVLDIVEKLSQSADLASALPSMLESLFISFPQADRGLVILQDSETGKWELRASRTKRPGESATVSKTLVQQVLGSGKALLLNDVGADERFDSSMSMHQARIVSVMCVPMLATSGTVLGLVQIDALGRPDAFQPEDLEILVCAATQAARAIEMGKLHEEQRDLEAASSIQRAFLPREAPKIDSLTFFHHHTTVGHVGGDYFDYIPLPGNRLAVAIGDVSGKGVAAALLMARLSAAARFCLATQPNVADAVDQINRLLITDSPTDRFVTFAVVVVDLAGWSATLVNAGHLLPILRRSDRSVVELTDDIAGLPLGIVVQPYQQMAIDLMPGDQFVLCTDGVTEHRNPQGDLYGAAQVVQQVSTGPAGVVDAARSLLANLSQFAHQRPAHDDLTLVCFGRNWA